MIEIMGLSILAVFVYVWVQHTIDCYFELGQIVVKLHQGAKVYHSKDMGLRITHIPPLQGETHYSPAVSRALLRILKKRGYAGYIVYDEEA